MSQTLHIMRGLPGSGKSTYAKRLVMDDPAKTVRVNKDLMREMFNCGLFSPGSEEYLNQLTLRLVEDCLKQGVSVVVDNMNLDVKHLRRYGEIIQYMNYQGHTLEPVQIEVVDLEMPINDCILRDGQRQGLACVGHEVIRKISYQFLEGGWHLPDLKQWKADFSNVTITHKVII